MVSIFHRIILFIKFSNVSQSSSLIKEEINSLRLVLIDLELFCLNRIIQWNKVLQHDTKHERVRVNCR